MADTTDEINSGNNYMDSKGNKLEIGFYKSCGANNLIYFNGNYNSEGQPNVEREKENGFESETLNTQLVRRLYRIGKEEVRDKLESLKKKTQWLEKILNE
jgi:hypothetical protein